ncbi:hypothetical protein NBRC116591_24020 [Sessilibacter corallicola]|uniref:Uncharacterized protein n=2 Tax=Sessilibacter corallicola TaxID=2904075 RepID=A0ABQ0AAC4_9GAMM
MKPKPINLGQTNTPDSDTYKRLFCVWIVEEENMRDELANEEISTNDILNGIGDELNEFTELNEQIDARRKLEDALEARRLSREIQEFDFDFDDLDE